MLSAEERASLIEALREWARAAPNEPMVGFLGQPGLRTPREIVTDVEENTSTGRAVLRILEHGVRREGIREVVTRLRRQIAVY